MSTLSGPNTRLPRSSCSTLLLNQPEPTMSPLTLLTATVVVLGLGCWVPTGAFYNSRMKKCNRTAMPVVSANVTKLQGRWYLSYYTVDDDEQTKYDGLFLDVSVSIPLAKNADGLENRVFYVIKSTTTSPTDTDCKEEQLLDQIIGSKSSGKYRAWNSPKSGPGHYIFYLDKYVLATDYTSTAVLFTELIFNGSHDITKSGIKVFVRNPATKPNADVVDAALHGFCEGDFLDLSSNFWTQIPNDSKLPCFTAQASSGAGDK